MAYNTNQNNQSNPTNKNQQKDKQKDTNKNQQDDAYQF